MLGNIRRAEHLKEEDSTPPTTHTAGTHVFGVNESHFIHTGNVFHCESYIASPTNKTPAASFRSKIGGRLWMMPRYKTEGPDREHTSH